MIIKRRIFGVSVIFLVNQFTGYRFRKDVVYVAIATTFNKAKRMPKLLKDTPVYSYWCITHLQLKPFIKQYTRILGAWKAMGMDRIPKGEKLNDLQRSFN